MKHFFILLFVNTTILLASNFECSYYKDHDFINVKNAGAVGNGKIDDTSIIQKILDCGSTLKIPIFIPRGNYVITKPLYLSEDLHLYGVGRNSKIIVQNAIGMTMRDDEKADFLNIENLSLVYRNPKPSKNDVALLLKSHSYSKFTNLYFFNFNDQIICHMKPTYRGRPARNIVFNTYRSWYVRQCRIGVIYEGLGKENSKGPISIISNNNWYDMIFRQVKQSAILAKSWADSERWYNLYAQASEKDAILVNLNESSDVWKQIDRFHFYSPVLVYDPSLKANNSNIIAIRFGKGTMRHYIMGLISDKHWPNGIIRDNDAVSYEVNGNTGEGFKKGPRVLKKGIQKDKIIP